MRDDEDLFGLGFAGVVGGGFVAQVEVGHAFHVEEVGFVDFQVGAEVVEAV